MARSSSLPHRKVVQAKALLLAGDGVANEEIARRCETTPDTVRRWRAAGATLVFRLLGGRPRSAQKARHRPQAALPASRRQRPAAQLARGEVDRDQVVASASLGVPRRHGEFLTPAIRFCLQQAGATIVKQGHDTFWGGYAGYFQDPDGHLWEVAWNPDWSNPE